ncbi:preprotein translocase subunit YajC [candidate division KSB1 bacterium]|nr:preprotein translocase subunit YajC [candidate division KSB1 bacterium]
MNMLFVILMSGAAGGGQGQPNTFGFFLPIILIFLIMYFLIFRPQMKKQKEQKQMIESLRKGDKVITVGGIFGTIAGIKEKEGTLILKIADNTKVELAKTSIAKVVGSE